MKKAVLALALALCLFGMCTAAENADGRAWQHGEMPQRAERMMPPDGAAPPDMQGSFVPPDMQRGGRGAMPGNMPEMESDFLYFLDKYQTPIIAMFLLIFGFVFVILYKRKNF